MDFLEKLKDLNEMIKQTKEDEEEVDQGISNEDNRSDRELEDISEQEERIIEEIELIEEEFLNVVGENSSELIDNAEEVLELEKLTLEECRELTPILSDLAGTIKAIDSSVNSLNADSRAIEQINMIKSRLNSLEQRKKEILSDLGEGERNAIEFLISTKQVEEEIRWLEKLVRHLETEEKDFESLAESIYDKKQFEGIESRQEEIQKIEEGLRQLEGRLEDLEALRSTQSELATEAHDVKTNFVKEARKVFKAASNTENLSSTLEQELEMLKTVVQRLSESSESFEQFKSKISRRGLIAGIAAGIGVLGVDAFLSEREGSKEIEEIEKDHEKELEKSNDIRGEKRSGKIIAHYISSRSKAERSMRVDYENKSENPMKLELEYIIPEDLKLVDANILDGEIISESENKCLIVLEIPPGKQKYTQLEMKLLKGKPEKVEVALKPDSAQNPDQITIPINNS